MYVYEIKKEKQHHHRKRYLKCDLKKNTMTFQMKNKRCARTENNDHSPADKKQVLVMKLL
jgi:hypothetical protein